MPLNKNAYRRYFTIDLMLRHRRFPAKRDIAEECEVSEEMIKKDIDNLRLEPWNAPIAYDQKKQGYYYTEPNYWLPAMILTDQELDALSTIQQLLAPFTGSNLYNEFQKLLKQINRFTEASSDHHPNREKDPFDGQFEQSLENILKPAKVYGATAYFFDLFKAARTCRQVHILYRSWNDDQPRWRTICPYGLKQHLRNWYAVAKDTEEDKVKTYLIHRIADLRFSEDYFLPDEDFNMEDFFANVQGIMNIQHKEPEELELHINANLVGRLKELVGEETVQQETNASRGMTRIVLYIQLNDELLRNLVKFGPDLQVISPTYFREQLFAFLESIQQAYKEVAASEG